MVTAVRCQRPGRAIASVLLGISLASCSSPTQPAPPEDVSERLPAGEYWLSVTTSDAQARECRAEPSKSPSFNMPLRVTVSRDGNGWVARSTSPADGDIELRLRETGPALVVGRLQISVNVEGTIRGTGASLYNGSVVQEHVLFRDATRIEGTLASSVGTGTIAGAIEQTSNSGLAICPAAAWILLPPLPAF